MKRNILVIVICVFFQFQLFAKQQEAESFWDNSQIEFSGLYGVLGDYGVLTKGKKEVFNKKHIEGLYGLSFQFSYASETDKFSDGVEGNTKDLGAYLTFDLVYYPF
ncbi:MAG: hypothetical protein KC414_09980, partial [Romboutsia sp.]|nr:hypothetical protein [Romboutsia sp.]